MKPTAYQLPKELAKTILYSNCFINDDIECFAGNKEYRWVPLFTEKCQRLYNEYIMYSIKTKHMYLVAKCELARIYECEHFGIPNAHKQVILASDRLFNKCLMIRDYLQKQKYESQHFIDLDAQKIYEGYAKLINIGWW